MGREGRRVAARRGQGGPAKEAALAALANAREGTSLLCGHLRALTPEDWQFLASLCAPDVGAALAARAAPLTAECLADRASLDAFVGSFLARFECPPCDPEFSALTIGESSAFGK